jgi:manganese/iron transport system permease protein/iron/zinc/copper transport system permease protein
VGLASALAINAVRAAAGSAPTPRSASSRPPRSPSASRCSPAFGNHRPVLRRTAVGSINGVSEGDLLLLTGALVCAVLVFTVGYRAFLFSSFDPEVAGVSGVRVKRMDALLMVVLSLSILATLQIIGVTLVAATLVIPAVVARMSSDSFSRMLGISTGLGATAGAWACTCRTSSRSPPARRSSWSTPWPSWSCSS